MLMDYYPLVVKRFVPTREARDLERVREDLERRFLSSFESSKTNSIDGTRQERRRTSKSGKRKVIAGQDI